MITRSRKIIFLGTRARPVHYFWKHRRFSKLCRILNISQRYRPRRLLQRQIYFLICKWYSYLAVRISKTCYGIASLFMFRWCSYLIGNTSPQPVTGIALLFICIWCSYVTGNTRTGLRGLLRGRCYFLYVDDVRISEETHVGPLGPVTGIAFHPAFLNSYGTNFA
jgi:hypothetical protein